MKLSSVTHRDRILGGLWGSLVGDALGVPVEFKSRAAVQADPVTDMRGFGTHGQPPGTWSDDGSLLLCTVDSLLAAEFDTADMAKRFVRWLQQGFWAAGGDAFDVGMATNGALVRVEKGVCAEEAGGRGEFDNGNGSLMRMIPVALRFAGGATDVLIDRVERASSITHGHARSKMACSFHDLIVRRLADGESPAEAYRSARAEFGTRYKDAGELDRFDRLLKVELGGLSEGAVVSTGYVLATLQASLWCLLNSRTYDDCVLKAVNLGGDTDTTGCVAGGLAGVLYGVGAIPLRWREALAKREEVAKLFERFADLVEPEQR